MENDRQVFGQVMQGAQYFSRIGRGAIANTDSVLAYSWIFFTAAQINPRISRFEALKGRGKLDIIEDKKKLYSIIDLYQKIFPNIFRINQAFNDLNTDKIAPYIGEVIKIDSNGLYTNTVEILRSSRMRLLLMQLEGSAANSLKAYSNGITKSNDLLKQVEEELK